MRQAQSNIRQMRDEKEHMNAHIGTLSNQIKELEGQLRDQDEVMRDIEEQSRQKQNEIYAKDRII